MLTTEKKGADLQHLVPVAAAAKEMGVKNKTFKVWAKKAGEKPIAGIERKKKDRWSNKMLPYYEVFYLRAQVDRIIKNYKIWLAEQKAPHDR